MVATSVIPAYAASICGDLQAMMQGGSTYFFWGEAETTSATSAYWDLNSTQLEITGLAPNETVTSSAFTIYVEDYKQPAADAMPTGYHDPTAYTTSVNYTPTNGWNYTATGSTSTQSFTFDEGIYSVPVWSVSFSNSTGTGGTYTTTSTGCKNYISGNISSFTYSYKGFSDLTEAKSLM